MKSPFKGKLNYLLPFFESEQDIKQLESGSIYWIATQDISTANHLLIKTIHNISEAGKLALITLSDPDSILSNIDSSTVQCSDIRVYQTRQFTDRFFEKLPQQLDRALSPKNRLIILYLNDHAASVWSGLSSATLRAWRNWIEGNGCTLLIVSSGISEEQLFPVLYSAFRSLSGVSFLSTKNTLPTYYVLYWHSAIGCLAKHQYKIKLTSAGLQFLPLADPQEQVSFYDANHAWHANLVFQQQVVQEAASFLSDQAHIVDSWEQMAVLGLREISMTLVFGLGVADKLEDLARLIHDLRIKRGASLKIFVRELDRVLRQPEVDLLLQAGVNDVIPNMGLSRFLDYLQHKIKNPSSYVLSDDLEQAVSLATPLAISGLLSAASFVQHMQNLLPRIIKGTSAGILVSLRPVPMISATQLASQLNLQRQGDIACAADDVLYLFLYACQPEFLNLTLRRIFTLPYESLIIENKFSSDPASIEKEIYKIRHFSVSSDNALSDQTPASLALTKQRFSPRRIAQVY